MPTRVVLPVGVLSGFLLVLARVAGALALVPLPGFASAAGTARAGLAVALTLALHSRWPKTEIDLSSPAALAAAVVMETAVGVALGVTAAIVLEAFTFAAQVLGQPAGFGYASTVDPTTQADSGVLLVVAQLFGGLSFFALGFDRQVLRLLAESLERIPDPAREFSRASAGILVDMVGSLLSVGVRLALPVVAVLVLVDVALALLGRLNSQVHMMPLSFPIKMLAALLVLVCVVPLFPRVLSEWGGQMWNAVQRVLGL
ncbi:MAG: flagellar biosynthetic protein FliR [Bryobacteraceae bacterium]|jgi:flagellar biosynthetic protein FliR